METVSVCPIDDTTIRSVKTGVRYIESGGLPCGIQWRPPPSLTSVRRMKIDRHSSGEKVKPVIYIFSGLKRTNIVSEYMICASFGGGRNTDLQIIRHGCLTAVQYTGEISRPGVVSMAANISSSFIFMDDNVRPHRAHPGNSMLQEEVMGRMVWLMSFSDFNSKEHFWEAVQRVVMVIQQLINSRNLPLCRSGQGNLKLG